MPPTPAPAEKVRPIADDGSVMLFHVPVALPGGSNIGDGAALRENGYGDCEPERRDIDDPGRGLGLGGALSSIDSLAFSSRRGFTVGKLMMIVPSVPVPDIVVIPVVTVGSCASCRLGIFGRSFCPCGRAWAERAVEGRRSVEMKRGFRPLSSTFFRALALTQLIICRSASRSDTMRVGRVEPVPEPGSPKPPVRGMVDCACGVIAGRTGVVNRLRGTPGSEKRVSNMTRLSGREAMVEGVVRLDDTLCEFCTFRRGVKSGVGLCTGSSEDMSSKALGAGPHEKPGKALGVGIGGRWPAVES